MKRVVERKYVVAKITIIKETKKTMEEKRL